VLIENVPGMVSFENGETLHAILNSLAELGYGADVRIMGAAYYGVSQIRWRTVILGLCGKSVPMSIFPEPIYQAPIRPNFTATFNGHSLLKMLTLEKDLKFVTVYEAISDLPSLKNGKQGKATKQYCCEPSSDFQKRVRAKAFGVVNHEAPRLADINIKRLQYIKPGGNWTDIPYELLPKGMK
jgi:DNA (cytosine-5)-methyltransferase 1